MGKKKVFFCAMFLSLAVASYINLFGDIELQCWDRIIGPAVLAGISESRRIAGYYVQYIFVLPSLFFGAFSLFSWVGRKSEQCLNALFYIETTLVIPAIVALSNKFDNWNVSGIENNYLFNIIIGFSIVLIILAKVDTKKKLKEKDIIFAFVIYIVVKLTVYFFCNGHSWLLIEITALCFVLAIIVLWLRIPGHDNPVGDLKCSMSVLFYIPFIAGFILEVLYILTGGGIHPQLAVAYAVCYAARRGAIRLVWK